jgi:hypothetical protein
MNREFISLQMSWTQAAKMLSLVLRDGTPKGKAEAMAELINMGGALDLARAEIGRMEKEIAELKERRLQEHLGR